MPDPLIHFSIAFVLPAPFLRTKAVLGMMALKSDIDT